MIWLEIRKELQFEIKNSNDFCMTNNDDNISLNSTVEIHTSTEYHSDK